LSHGVVKRLAMFWNVSVDPLDVLVKFRSLGHDTYAEYYPRGRIIMSNVKLRGEELYKAIAHELGVPRRVYIRAAQRL